MLGAGHISKESHLWYSLAMSKYYHECHLCQLCFHNYMAHHIYTNHEMKAAFPKHTKHHWDQRQHHFSFSSSLSKPLHKLLLLQSSWIMSMISSTRYSDAFTSLQTWPTWVKTCSSTVNQVDIKHSLAPNIVPYGHCPTVPQYHCLYTNSNQTNLSTSIWSPAQPPPIQLSPWPTSHCHSILRSHPPWPTKTCCNHCYMFTTTNSVSLGLLLHAMGPVITL